MVKNKQKNLFIYIKLDILISSGKIIIEIAISIIKYFKKREKRKK